MMMLTKTTEHSSCEYGNEPSGSLQYGELRD
jgi:hypothetical protein